MTIRCKKTVRYGMLRLCHNAIHRNAASRRKTSASFIAQYPAEVKPVLASIQPVARCSAIASIALAALLGAGSVLGQPYPNKPIKLFVGFPPGGGSDALARLVGAALPEKLSQHDGDGYVARAV